MVGHLVSLPGNRLKFVNDVNHTLTDRFPMAPQPQTSLPKRRSRALERRLSVPLSLSLYLSRFLSIASLSPSRPLPLSLSISLIASLSPSLPLPLSLSLSLYRTSLSPRPILLCKVTPVILHGVVTPESSGILCDSRLLNPQPYTPHPTW